MGVHRTILVAITISWLAASSALCQPHEDAGRKNPSFQNQTVEDIRGSLPGRPLESRYLLFLPKSYQADVARRWPLIVHLHGGGGRGTDPSRLVHYPLVQRLENEPDFPFVVVTPQCPYGRRDDELGDTWVEHADLVLAVIDDVVANHRIDLDRVSIVGHSMGGNGAWYLGHLEPERWAAVVPMSSPAVVWWAYRIAKDRIPTWVFHGLLDEAVPVVESQRMVDAMKQFDGDVRSTEYPQGGHAIKEPFEGDELFDWLLKQDRSARQTQEPDAGGE